MALPEVQRLVEEGRQNNVAAFKLITEAAPYLAGDPGLEAALSRVATETDVETQPPGATVHVKAYNGSPSVITNFTISQSGRPTTKNLRRFMTCCKLRSALTT